MIGTGTAIQAAMMVVLIVAIRAAVVSVLAVIRLVILIRAGSFVSLKVQLKPGMTTTHPKPCGHLAK